MQAQLQVGKTDGFVVLAVFDFPATLGIERRWVKTYPTIEDACWDMEQLELISPKAVAIIKGLPRGNQIPPVPGYVRNLKETLRSFQFSFVTQLQ